MNHDFLYALYVFCSDYHSGQWSRGYRIMSRFHGAHYRIQINDKTMEDIRKANTSGEWEESHYYYRKLVRKFAHKI